MRVNFRFRARGARTAAELGALADAWPAAQDEGEEWLRVGGVKLGVDGGFEGGWMHEPYAEPFGRGGTFHGLQTMPADRFTMAVTELNRRGWRVATHAVGDGAIDEVLARPGTERPRPSGRASIPAPPSSSRTSRRGCRGGGAPSYRRPSGAPSRASRCGLLSSLCSAPHLVLVHRVRRGGEGRRAVVVRRLHVGAALNQHGRRLRRLRRPSARVAPPAGEPERPAERRRTEAVGERDGPDATAGGEVDPRLRGGRCRRATRRCTRSRSGG